MRIYPAIDLKNGRCVRLQQGDPNKETVFGDDPAQMARHWVGLGAEWLHVVNLDGAFSGSANFHPKVKRLSSDAQLDFEKLPTNLHRLQQIRQAVDVPIQFAGGLRSLDDIKLAFSLGADRIILGTAAVRDPELVRAAIERWGGPQVLVSLDAKEGKVATHGWQNVSQVSAVELGHRMAAVGVERVLYTDISRDGMLSGVNVQATSALADMTGLQVIASGGVAGLDDIHALKRHEHYGIDGVITGQALYTGSLDLPAAIAIGKGPRVRRSAGIIPYRCGAGQGAIVAGPQLLLLYNHFFEEWQFPRGGVKPGESDLDRARREFSTETGLPLRRILQDHPTVLSFTVNIRGYDVERTIVYFPAEVEDGEVRLGHDNHSECRWCSLEEARDLLQETSPEQLPAWQAAARLLKFRSD
ncbi:MAG: HisA/HisF-related TIM barrel protein [Caldilineaceae bacterium]|nr:HisA/HisF-related TIM barrel protein [Caldilineaceae bacterium]